MSGLSLDDFVALNALIVTAMGLSFVGIGRRQKPKPLLNLKVSNSKVESRTIVNGVSRNRSDLEYGAAALARLEAEDCASETDESLGSQQGQVHLKLHRHSEVRVSRDLNVFFNWNGHTWDAYEVLGVPAGSSREAVIEAFHAARAGAPDSTAFLQAATDAVLKRS